MKKLLLILVLFSFGNEFLEASKERKAASKRERDESPIRERDESPNRSEKSTRAHRDETQEETCGLCLNALDKTEDDEKEELGSPISLLGQQEATKECPHKVHKNCFSKYVVSRLRPADDYGTLMFVARDETGNITERTDELPCPLCRAPIKKSVLETVPAYNEAKLLLSQQETNRRGDSPNRTDQTGLNPLLEDFFATTRAVHHAARNPDATVLRALLARLDEAYLARHDMNIYSIISWPDNDGLTAVHHAAQNPNEAVLRAFLAIPMTLPGLSVHDIITRPDHAGLTVFHHAAMNANGAVLREILEFMPGYSCISWPDNDGLTVVHHAARNPDATVLRALLARLDETRLTRYFMDVNVYEFITRPDHAGLTAFHHAARNPDEAVLRALLAIPSINVYEIITRPDHAGLTVFHHAGMNPNEAVLLALLPLSGGLLDLSLRALLPMPR